MIGFQVQECRWVKDAQPKLNAGGERISFRAGETEADTIGSNIFSVGGRFLALRFLSRSWCTTIGGCTHVFVAPSSLGLRLRRRSCSELVSQDFGALRLELICTVPKTFLPLFALVSPATTIECRRPFDDDADLRRLVLF